MRSSGARSGPLHAARLPGALIYSILLNDKPHFAYIQIELLHSAMDHNCIVSLGTGFGKTYIAVLLIKEYTQKLLDEQMKAFFIVDKSLFEILLLTFLFIYI